jgi:hypothetical protein
VLWRNDSGIVTDWLSSGGSFAPNTSASGTASVPPDWHVSGTGDFNGDGLEDILWRNDAGTVTDWLSNGSGGFVHNDAVASANVPVDWHVAGTGDFNGDGRADILWRNDNGTTTDWFGTGTGGFTTANNWTGTPPTNWHVAGTGDFNGDGRADILWRNDAGIITDWLSTASGFAPNNNADGSFSVPLNWQVLGTGDFNGDGRADILWRNDTGIITDWLSTASGGFAPNNDASASASVPLNWHVVGVGDYNGDAIDDILWRNDNGTTTDWFGTATGGFTTANNWTGTPPTNWHVQDPFF